MNLEFTRDALNWLTKSFHMRIYIHFFDLFLRKDSLGEINEMVKAGGVFLGSELEIDLSEVRFVPPSLSTNKPRTAVNSLLADHIPLIAKYPTLILRIDHILPKN